MTRALALLLLLAAGCASTRPGETVKGAGFTHYRPLVPWTLRREYARYDSIFGAALDSLSRLSVPVVVEFDPDTISLEGWAGLPRTKASANDGEPVPPATTIRLRWTMPDSIEWRRPGFGRADSAAVAQSGQSGEVWWVPRFGPPYWPPVYAESLIYTTGHRFPGSAVDVTVTTPGHGALFVRARNAAGAWPVRSNLTHARARE